MPLLYPNFDYVEQKTLELNFLLDNHDLIITKYQTNSSDFEIN